MHVDNSTDFLEDIHYSFRLHSFPQNSHVAQQASSCAFRVNVRKRKYSDDFAQFALYILVIFSVTCREVLAKYNLKRPLLF